MNNKQRLIISVITFLAFALMSVGFATYNMRLDVKGGVTLGKNGKVAITNVELISSSNINNPQNPTFTDNSISFNLNFDVQNNNQLDKEYSATYQITLTNTSFYDYIFASSTFTPSVETTNNQDVDVTFTIEGIEVGDIIATNEVKTFTATINMYPKKTGNYDISGDTEVKTEQDEVNSYSILASIPKDTTIDLTGSKTTGEVIVSVINTYPERKTFTITNNGNNFTLVDNKGNDLRTLTIAANTTSDYAVYIKRKDGVTFPSSPQKINLYFTPTNGNKTGIGTVSILVDVDTTLLDDKAPLINNVNAELVNENGKVKLTWDYTDDSGLDHSIIEIYDDTDNLINTITTTNSDTQYTITGLSDGTYYFKVYGVDNSQYKNSGKDSATTCTTSEGYCSRSTSSSYQWTFNVTKTCNACTITGDDTILIGSTYTATLRVNNNMYRLDNNITITMGTKTLQATEYTYDATQGTLSIPNVTGDLNINGSATFTCLVEGTKILLANGKYKNVEDITYNDLLTVWNYETGSITYEYPIWLEKESSIDRYRKTTFSDGSSISTVGYHGMFSTTYNEFISVDDIKRFKVGTKVLKLKDGKLKEVEIVQIEDINKKVKYYHVVSTRYYNVFANDVLTTDGTVILSNLYGFDNNVTWPSNRKSIMSKGLYKYDEFKDIIPYYMFKGMRMEEGKHLENFGFTKDLFKYYLLNNQVNEEMIRKVDTSKNGTRLWMVTTSEDDVNELNKNKYLYEEGSYYKLPIIKGVKKWYSTSESKYYNPNEYVKVNHGMHFIKVK